MSQDSCNQIYRDQFNSLCRLCSLLSSNLIAISSKSIIPMILECTPVQVSLVVTFLLVSLFYIFFVIFVRSVTSHCETGETLVCSKKETQTSEKYWAINWHMKTVWEFLSRSSHIFSSPMPIEDCTVLNRCFLMPALFSKPRKIFISAKIFQNLQDFLMDRQLETILTSARFCGIWSDVLGWGQGFSDSFPFPVRFFEGWLECSRVANYFKFQVDFLESD